MTFLGHRIITFAGMPGSGKSCAAKAFAAQLSASGQQASWIDLDAEVERRSGKSIARIFAEDGERVFRSLEKATLQDILKGDFSAPATPPVEMTEKTTVEPSSCHVEPSSCHVERSRDISILALGGGTLQVPENLELVKKYSYCIWLDTPLETIADRLWASGDIGQRPLLASAKTKNELLALLQNLYSTRKSAYQAAAKMVISG